MIIDGYVRDSIIGDRTYYSGGDISKYRSPLWMTCSSAIPRRVIKDENKENKMTNKETNRMSGLTTKLNTELNNCISRCKELEKLLTTESNTKSLENLRGDALSKIVDALHDFNVNALTIYYAVFVYNDIEKNTKKQESDSFTEDIFEDGVKGEFYEENNLSLLFAKMLKKWPR